MVAHPRGPEEGAGQALDQTWELGHTGPRGGGGLDWERLVGRDTGPERLYKWSHLSL